MFYHDDTVKGLIRKLKSFTEIKNIVFTIVYNLLQYKKKMYQQINKNLSF